MHLDARGESGYFRAMNAVVREKYEVPMLTNEVIEVHLGSLRAGQDELKEDVRGLQADNRSIRDKIDAVHTSMNQKIDAVDARLTQEIRAVDKKLDQRFDSLNTKIDEKFDSLNGRIDTVNGKIDTVNANLGEKITQLSNAVAGMRGMQKTIVWLIGIFGSLGTVGKFLHWF
jgi:predicted  nucleic acid-binding Zn-ribbon protein